MTGDQRKISANYRFPIPGNHIHNFPKDQVPSLIRKLFELIPADPVPKIIIVKSIGIFPVKENELEIRCEALFET